MMSEWHMVVIFQSFFSLKPSNRPLWSEKNPSLQLPTILNLHLPRRTSVYSNTMAGIFRVTSAATHLARRIGLNPILRSFGAAAAVELQRGFDYYDDDDDNELSSDRFRLVPTNDSDGSIEGRGVQWVFIGSPGSKKHVYAGKLSKLLQVPHISMSTLVRQELSPRSFLYKQIANAVNEGKLVPEDIIFGLLSKRLEDGYYRGETGFILDGIPRTRIQAEILDQIADIDLVVNFRCTEDYLVKKRLGMCPQCHESISIGNLGPNLAKTSFAGTEDAQKEKFQISEKQNKPLEDYYRKQLKLIDFQVAGSSGETWQGLLSVLHLKHINAIHSSQMELYNISQSEPDSINYKRMIQVGDAVVVV